MNKRGGVAKYNQLGHIKPYVMECFRRLNKDLKTCELCGITGVRLDIHHTKYEGATVYDLQLVCRSCNLKAENCYLK